MEELIEGQKPLDSTFDVFRVRGVRVLTPRGTIFGKVLEVRVGKDSTKIEGIVVRRGLFKRNIYIGRSYIEKFSTDSIILNIEPITLLLGKRVISFDGETLGKITRLEREDKSNSVIGMVVSSFSRGNIKINPSDIKSVGDSIILKQSYVVPKKGLWRRNK